MLQKAEYSKLEVACEKALAVSGAPAALYHLKGLSQLAQKKYQQAISSFSMAIENSAACLDTYVNLATAYVKHGNIEKAIELYTTAYTLTKQDKGIAFRLGKLLLQQQDYKRALPYLETAATTQKHQAEAETLYGIACYNLQDYEKALQWFSNAEKSTDSVDSILVYKAKTYKKLKKYKDAIECYLRCQNTDQEACLDCAELCFYEGRYDKARELYLKLYILDPQNLSILSSLSEILSLSYKNIKTDKDICDALTSCLIHSNIESAKVNKACATVLKNELLCFNPEELISLGVKYYIYQLLIAYLRNSPVMDVELESWLIHLRKWLTYSANLSDSKSNTISMLLLAFAYQSRLNEYLWFQEVQEQKVVDRIIKEVVSRIEENKQPDCYDLYKIAAYRDIEQHPVIGPWARKQNSHYKNEYQQFLSDHFTRQEQLNPIMQEIPVFGNIQDQVSREVQHQYEENPYPQWNDLPFVQKQTYQQCIKTDIYPNNIEILSSSDSPRILIAGCGTGRQAAIAARRYKDCSIIAFDISLNSLAYAAQKIQQHRIKNVTLYQADILDISSLDGRFDLIECTGVLHHMENPEKGLQSLLQVLKPGGFLKLGLYSNYAREEISQIRQELQSFVKKRDLENIREFRKYLQNEKPKLYRRLGGSADFYNSSSFVDLLLHVKEHVYTLSEIEQLLKQNSLLFMGFVFAHARFKMAYLERYPDDPSCLNLKYWNETEKEKKQLFSGMYQFWCKKLA